MSDMDAGANPFNPGAGAPPPELAGREKIIADAKNALVRMKAGAFGRSQMLLGLRGTGKTVLLNHLEDIALELGFQSAFLEAQEDRKFLEIFVPQMNKALRSLSRFEAAKHLAGEASGALRAFASAFKVNVGGLVEMGVDPQTGSADSGDLELDLTDMFLKIGRAARAAQTGWVICIDEVQYLDSTSLSALITAIHRCNQKSLPIILFLAGLPQAAKIAAEHKSYSERLFFYPQVGALDSEAATRAIKTPFDNANIDISSDALERVVQQTGGYPFFIQQWGYQLWDCAVDSPITLEDVDKASELALSALDKGFFRVRLDRLTPSEVAYVYAMSEIGAGPYKTADIAARLNKENKSLGPARAQIMSKGMIYSPQHGEVDFTVPLFDQFLRRHKNSSGDPQRSFDFNFD